MIFVFSTCWLFPIPGRDASPYLHQQRWNDCPVTFGSRNFMCFGWFGGNSASLCLSWMVQKIRQKCREHDLNHGTTTGWMRNPQCKGTSAADEHVFVLTRHYSGVRLAMSFLKIKTPIKTWPLPTENHHHSFWQYVSPDPTPIRKKRNEGNIRLCICNHLYMIVFCCLFQKLAPSFTAISSWPCPHWCGRGVAAQPCWQFSALLGPCPVERCWEGSYLPCQRVVLMGRYRRG